MKAIFCLTLFIALLLTLNACKQTDKSVPTIEEPNETTFEQADETALFTSIDLRNATVVKEESLQELQSLDLNNDETGVELPFDEDEEVSELDTQSVIAGASGWLALYRVKDSDGLNQIRLHDQSNNTNRVTVYSDTDAVESVAVSADGNTVVAAINNPVDNRNDIYLFDIIADQMYQLTTTASRNESDVSITADGLTIAYQRKKSGGLETPYICTYDPITHSCSNSVIIDVLHQIQPSLSANGNYLAVVKLLGNGDHQVGLYDLTANPSPTYTTIETKADVLGHPSVDDTGTQIMYLWEKSLNGKDYARIKDLTGPSFSNEVGSSAGLDHPFITRYASYTTYQQYINSQTKYRVKTRKISNNAGATPQSGAWEYFSPFWMMPTCGVGTTVTGKQTLSTQAQVDALEGISTIMGKLIIAPTSTSLDLSPLYLLTEVTGELRLHDEALQTTLSGLECLTTVGGDFRITQNANLSSITGFPLLTSVGGFFGIHGNYSLNTITNFPLLASVGDYFQISTNVNLENIANFPLLASVGGSFNIYENESLSTIANFPLLASIGNDFQISNNDSLNSIPDFPLLASVGSDFNIDNNAVLSSITGFNQLTVANITGLSTISNNTQFDCSNPAPNFAPVDFSTGNLVDCQLDLSCGGGSTKTGDQTLSTQVQVDALEGFSTITGNLIIAPTNTSLDLSPLYRLTDVTSNLEIQSLQTTLSGFECLTTVGGHFGGGNGSLESVSDFPVLASIGGDFVFVWNNSLSSIGDFPVLASVGRHFLIFHNPNLNSIPDFPLLASVGDDFLIYDIPNLDNIPDFPVLASVGNNFQIYDNPNLNSISDFPVLASVGNNFQISNNDSLNSIPDFPFLTSVGGISIYGNDSLISIAGVNQLTSANISGLSTISDNPQFDCSNPAPNFAPVDFSTGNLVDCQLDLSCGGGSTITGDKTLSTQAQVDALIGVSTIIGNLDLHPVTNLDYSPLYRLTNVTGNFDLVDELLPTTLPSLECLTTVGGNFKISNNLNLENIPDFPLLASVGEDFIIEDNLNLENIPDLPLLTSLGEDFKISNNLNLENIPDLPLLTSIGEDFIIEDNLSVSNPVFVDLTSVGNDFIIRNNDSIISPVFFALASVGNDFLLTDNDNLISADGFPALASIGNDFRISENHNLESMNGFPLSTSLGGTFAITGNTSLSSISDFPLLASVGDHFTITGNTSLSSIGNFPLLASVRDFNIIDNDGLNSIGDFPLLASVRDFNITDNHYLSSIGEFPLLTSVRDFTIANHPNLYSTPELPLASVGGGFTVTSNTTIPELPLLASVGGNFVHTYSYAITDFPLLASVGGSISISFHSGSSSNPNIPDFPLLASVGGWVILTANPFVISISGFPLLVSAGSGVKIYSNLNLENISGFPLLVSTTNLEITNNSNLSSITGFNQLTPAGISGYSQVLTNPLFDCTNPVPNFVPVDISYQNLVDCPTN